MAKNGTATVVPVAPSQVRVGTGLAVLTMVGAQGLSRDAFFQRVYGFPFSVGAHKGVLDVLLHRMRKTIAPFGTIHRVDDVFTLTVDRPVILSDPRGAQSPEERLLAYLATAGPTSTEALGAALGLPLRTVQLVMQALTEEGACRALREGRHVRYQVEDTTFRA
jgi:hypothetical protein